ncbi:MAG: hypothetical protein JOZ43_02160 [Acidobacteriales bacterium]|nr:hypothetical protein [Terriglobales bacterium]
MQSEWLNQALSLAGALCILAAYVGHQMEWVRAEGVFYNVINAIGAAILGYVALHPFRLGFVVLEAAWLLVSVYALLRRRNRGTVAAA